MSAEPPCVLFVSYTAEEVGPTRSLLLLLRHIDPAFRPSVLMRGKGYLADELERLEIPYYSVDRISAAAVPGLSRFIRGGGFRLVYANTTDGSARNAVLAARLAGVRAMCHVRSMGREMRWHKLAHLRLASSVVAVSEACAQSVRGYVSPAKLHVVYNGLELEAAARAGRDHPDVIALRARAGADPESLVLLSLGHLCSRKSQVSAIRVVRCLRENGVDARLLIAGSTDREPEYTVRLQQAIEDMGLSSCVSLLGFRRDLPTLFGAADALLHTAVDDPHPRAVIEAMGAALPVAGFAADGVAESILDGATGVLAPVGSIEGLCSGLETIAHSRATANRWGLAGRERARMLFSAGRHGERISQLMWKAVS